MFPGIDHLVIAVADPDDAAAQLEAELGLIGVFSRALAERSWLGPSALRKPGSTEALT